MTRARKFFAPLLCLFGLSASAQAGDADYVAALDKELANRAVARQVVPKLAERHTGTEQGKFWSAYAALETAQLERYRQAAASKSLSHDMRGGTLKVQGSLLFARLFDIAFIRTLATATQDYLKELEALAAQRNADDQAFWAYVIDQERVQAGALALAAGQDFNAATAMLEAFIQQQFPRE